MSHGPLEMTGADDAPTCVDGVCDLPAEIPPAGDEG